MPDRPSWSEVRDMLRHDRLRLEEWLAPEGLGFSRWHPAYVCAVLYRLSHYLHRCGRKYLARAVWQANSFLTGSDFPPAVEIGPGLLVPCPAGAAVAGKVGRNFTLLMGAGVGGEIGRYEDIGAGPGLPVLGDEVLMEPRSGVLGPIRIGNRVRIAAGATATRDVPDDMLVEGPGARFLRLKS